MTTTPTSIAQGAAWSLASRGASQALQFAASIALARLIAPEAFGLVGMVATLTVFLGLFVDAGLGIALVQRKALEPANVNGAFALTICAGAVASALLVAAAPAVAHFYGAPPLADVTRATALAVWIGSFGIVPRALLVRAGRLGALALVDLGTAAIVAATSLGLGLVGAGVWALVASSIAGAAVSSGLLLASARWRPTLTSWRGARPLLAVGLNLLAYNAINYWTRTLDSVLIGAWIGERELGLYLRAYALMLLPLTELVAVLGASVVPALARAQDDHAAARAGYLKAVGVVALVSFPAMIGLSLVATPLVAVLYGPAWSGVAPILRILAIVGALQSVYSPVGWLYTSQGRTDRMFRWGLFVTAVTVPLLAYGAWLGSGVHVARSYLVANVLFFVPAYLYVGRLVGLRLRDLGAAVLPTAAATGAMALCVAGCGALLPNGVGNGARLGAQVAAGIASYVLATRLIANRAARDAADLVLEMRPGWRRWVHPIASLLAAPQPAPEARR